VTKSWCELPPRYQRTWGVLPVRETEGVVWLSAFPSLLPWPRPVAWLFFPGNSRRLWPGDAWGIDDAGNLLIVEAKVAAEQRQTCDPFEDFPASSLCTGATVLAARWCRLYAAEIRYLADGVGKLGTTPGILPYSNRRRALGIWPELERLAHRHVFSAAYLKRVWDGLRSRSKRSELGAHYFGYLVAATDDDPRLSASGERCWKRLLRTHPATLFGARAIRSENRVRIERIFQRSL
jgi:hypothetical protein